MAERGFVVWRTTTNPHGTGSWAVVDGVLTVRTCDGSKSTQLGGHSPEALARLLMWELCQEHYSR